MSGHSHGPSGAQGHRRRLAVVLAVSLIVLAAEVAGAVLSGSLALLADAGHVLTDVVGLSMSLAAATLALRPPSSRRTWGYRRAEVLSATAQAALLLAVGGYVMVEAVRRLASPPEVGPATMLALGAVGLAGNLIGLAVLGGVRADNLNLRAAFLEVVNDALGSVAVLAAAAVVALTGWTRADPVASLVIACLIIPRTLLLLRDSLSILLESTPRGLDLADVRAHLLSVEHVLDVHDLHATQVSSDLPVLTAHVVVEEGCFADGHAPALLDQLQACLAGHFDVEHSTLQLEPPRHSGHEALRH